MSDRPAGLLVPVTTPFDPRSGDIAPVSLRENTRAILEAGADGIVAAGSTGEAPLLDEQEFRASLEWLRDVVSDEQWLIAGTGRESTRATLVACAVAAEMGADAVLVRPPAYFAPSLSAQDIVAFFRRVADGSPIPVFVYNMPKYTHVHITPAQFAELADHQNIHGAKDSSGDLKNFAAYRDAAPDWTLFVGSGALYYAALELGAAGAIAAVGCFAAGALATIGMAFAAGDRSGAGATQERLAPLHKEIVAAAGIPGVKAAMDLVGLAGGPVRPPLSDLGDRDRDRVAAVLRAAGLVDVSR